jgi:hypothetical protein
MDQLMRSDDAKGTIDTEADNLVRITVTDHPSTNASQPRETVPATWEDL